MPNRKSLLVGSIPAADTAEAVASALGELGSTLIAIPDGETGDRKPWVAEIIDRLSDHPAFRLKKVGNWTSYKDVPRYGVRRGTKVDPASLNMGYLRAYEQSRVAVKTAVAQHDIEHLPFQSGVASGFDLALFSLGFWGALRHRDAFNAATAREITGIKAQAGGDVVFQIEVPAELVMVTRSPAVLRAPVAALMGRLTTELARQTPAGTRFGIHLCYGDLGNHSLVTGLSDCSAAVALTNSIVARWPSNMNLDYVHMPLAAGDEPPRLTPSYYAPLSAMKLPPHTRFVAGFVHEALTAEQLRDVLAMIERASGRTADVASACGLGRRTSQVAEVIMTTMRNLCQAPAAV